MQYYASIEKEVDYLDSLLNLKQRNCMSNRKLTSVEIWWRRLGEPLRNKITGFAILFIFAVATAVVFYDRATMPEVYFDLNNHVVMIKDGAGRTLPSEQWSNVLAGRYEYHRVVIVEAGHK
jgi:hypothetical protein